jgi:hypothetical protein
MLSYICMLYIVKNAIILRGSTPNPAVIITRDKTNTILQLAGFELLTLINEVGIWGMHPRQ